VKRYLQEKIKASLRAIGVDEAATITFEKPRQPEHGDLTTNIALILARKAGKNSRDLARDILAHMEIDNTLVPKAESAGPGFINFAFSPEFYRRQFVEMLKNEKSFGRTESGKGKNAQVEFVSANPTGPLTVGHGRNAVLGDTIANLLEWTGHDVTREYYFNNAGRQMRVLGDSVRLRYLEVLGEAISFPEDYYQGEYIREIARNLHKEHGDALRAESAEGKFKERAEKDIFEDIKKTLRSLGIEFRSFFNEDSLYSSGKIDELIGELRTRELVYDKDGALWLKTSKLGSEKDKVIVKSSGEPTYRLPDIAYHREKFHRGYDLMIDILGSDHIATYPDVLAAIKALGYDSDKVKVLIHQFVTILQDGEVVKMSTRKANFITLDELIDEVGADVVRYFFLMRSHTSHLNFDLNLAKQHSDENPVFYLQYAYARIASIVRHASEGGRAGEPSFSSALLRESEEIELIKVLLLFPETVESCALAFEPHRLTEYLHTVAGVFHKFYHERRVVSDDAGLTSARLALCRGTTAVLRNGFAILGISAPERM